MKKLNRYNRFCAPAAVLTTGLCASMFFAPFASPAGAQDRRAMTEQMAKELAGTRAKLPLPDEILLMLGDTNRSVVGVTTSSGGKDRADTAGVLIESVTAGSPAEKAGIKAGSRITAVNGVNLRVAAIDADDPELQGIGQRRLIREIGKAKVGDEIDLRVATGSSSQSYKLKTVSPEELSPKRTYSYGTSDRGGMEKHASLGATVGSTGSLRDTLGIFISGVVTGGPAEKAGIFEGDRIAAINGVDVRVPREDAEDAQASLARVNRFMRELAKSTPGDKITLRVYGGGRFREVAVTTGSITETMKNGFRFNMGEGGQMMSLPGMRMENMPMIIRGMTGDTNRIILRNSTPSGPRIIQRSGPVTIRKSAQQ
ncbi:MAG: PDZ domain-containing protein [Gemmatimonadaceae bacterium]